MLTVSENASVKSALPRSSVKLVSVGGSRSGTMKDTCSAFSAVILRTGFPARSVTASSVMVR